jgi:transcriptional regulator with XRE-family HTH domain
LWESDSRMEPGKRLKQARTAAGLSVEQLAERMGGAASTVRAHENGQNNIKPPMAQRYGSALGVAPEWLLYGRGEGDVPTLQLEGLVTVQLPIRYEAAAGAWLATDEVRDEPLGYDRAHKIGRDYTSRTQLGG